MPERRFGFYYTLGKFDENFNKKNDFCHCYGIFMTATLMPPNQEGHPDGYCLNVCCDRRSDPLVRLLTNADDISEIVRVALIIRTTKFMKTVLKTTKTICCWTLSENETARLEL